jgi:hypothetical protein
LTLLLSCFYDLQQIISAFYWPLGRFEAWLDSSFTMATIMPVSELVSPSRLPRDVPGIPGLPREVSLMIFRCAVIRVADIVSITEVSYQSPAQRGILLSFTFACRASINTCGRN